MDIKYFSQKDNEVPVDLQRSICGLACVKMIVDFYHPEENQSITDLIKEGNLIGAYDKKLELWIHDGLVRILRNHGISSYAQEFKSIEVDLENKTYKKSQYSDELMQKGIEKIMRFVKRNKPVITSFKEGFGENTDSHLVLIKDYKTAKGNQNPIFIIHDPISGPDIEVNLEHFLKYWRKFTIFVN